MDHVVGLGFMPTPKAFNPSWLKKVEGEWNVMVIHGETKTILANELIKTADNNWGTTFAAPDLPEDAHFIIIITLTKKWNIPDRVPLFAPKKLNK